MSTSNHYDIIVRSEASLQEFVDKLSEKGFVVQSSLAQCDFVIWTDKDPIYAERKSTNDYVRSVQDGSLFKQAEAMKDGNARGFFLIEDYSWRDLFNYTYKRGGERVGISPNSIIGSMDALVRKYNVGVISTLSKKGTLYWLTKVLEETKGIRKPHEYALRPSASKKLSLEDQAVYILQGYPELGPSNSKEIRRTCTSFMEFMSLLNGCGSDTIEWEQKLSTRVKNLLTQWRTISATNWKIKEDKHEE